MARLAVVALVFVLAQGCKSITLDMTALDEPVLLNGSMFVGADPEFDHVDSYAGTVQQSYVATSSTQQQGQTTTTTTTTQGQVTDTTLANAYEKVGAKLHHAIVDAEIDASCLAIYALFAFGEKAEIKLAGKVVRYRFRTEPVEGMD